MAIPPSLDAAETPGPRRKKILFGILRLALALGLAGFIAQIKLDYIEAYFYDLRTRIRPAPATTGHLEMIFVDPVTIRDLKRSPGFGAHARLLEILSTASARAIVYDLDPTQLKGSDQDRALFLRVAAGMPNLLFLTDDLEMNGEEGKLRFPAPFDKLRVAPGPKSSDTSNFAKDGVTRRFLISYQDRPTAHVELARLFRPRIADTEKVRGRFSFLGTEQSHINFRPPRSYPESSLSDLIDGHESAARFRDRIVLIGQDTQMSERDYARTPYSRESVGMRSAEVHANIIDTLLRNDAPARAPLWLNLFFIAVVSVLTVHVVFAMKPTRGLVILAFAFAGFTFLNFFLFWPFAWWVSLAHPLLAFFLCYYFFIPYRLIIENRRSWEIYQKHRLLQQVEELKTNFISMMSHDLKTPIARIQGMTDIIQRDPTPLSNGQREALDTIRASGDDLLKFINAILQYGRIEAQQVPVRRQSRDINVILQDVIRRHEFLAKLKRIRLIDELEPLFPIPVDPELMGQVFSNLIENAIKYSPEDTKVLISSEEKDGRVVVQIADQGPGIPPDEIAHVFMKFFRSKNARSSTVKGSGLGLYLAR
ncbi:MAG: CHASE2 domain-containing protein, partial [Bdellovibrionaceae bacterium]|nr:CHASE2 domain-containing protein [Pseudobdellovibrionaceae bacterium]